MLSGSFPLVSAPSLDTAPPFHYLTIPGYRNSGEGHWQTIWESLYPKQFTRVQQENWEYPDKNSWINTIDKYVKNTPAPVILIAHSLGCIAAVQSAVYYKPGNIAGALFVAPADADESGNPLIKAFGPVPAEKLPFPSLVVASTNDPFAAIHRQANFAVHWGSKFVCVGDKGHINADSDLGEWEEGFDILQHRLTPGILINNPFGKW